MRKQHVVRFATKHFIVIDGEEFTDPHAAANSQFRSSFALLMGYTGELSYKQADKVNAIMLVAQSRPNELFDLVDAYHKAINAYKTRLETMASS